MPLIGSICLILKLDGGAVAEGASLVDVADAMEIALLAEEEDHFHKKKTLSLRQKKKKW